MCKSLYFIPQVRRHDGFAAAEVYLTSHPEIADAVRKTLYADVKSGKVLEICFHCLASGILGCSLSPALC